MVILKINKCNIWYRKFIDFGLRLVVILRYLVMGDSYYILMYGFRVVYNIICGIVREVCEVIVFVYLEDVFLIFMEFEQWKVIVEQFEVKWQFFYILGVIDGKYVFIRCLKNGGLLYYNYKGYYFIVLMVLVDVDYKF